MRTRQKATSQRRQYSVLAFDQGHYISGILFSGHSPFRKSVVMKLDHHPHLIVLKEKLLHTRTEDQSVGEGTGCRTAGLDFKIGCYGRAREAKSIVGAKTHPSIEHEPACRLLLGHHVGTGRDIGKGFHTVRPAKSTLGRDRFAGRPMAIIMTSTPATGSRGLKVRLDVTFPNW